MADKLIDVLIARDKMTKQEAEDLIAQAREDLMERLAEGEMPFDICEEWFGLEPDYLEDLL